MPRPAGAAALVVIGWLAAGPAGAQSPPDHDELIRRVRANLRTDAQLQSQYTYVEKRAEIRVSILGKVATGPEQVYQVYPSAEGGEPYRRLIATDGKPVPPEELEKQDRARQKKVLEAQRARARESASDREGRLKREAKGRRDTEADIADLFRLYEFRIVGHDVLDGHPAIVVDFAPRPAVKPETDVGKILKKAKGRVWISEDDYQIARVEAEIIDDIRVGLVLGRLNKGATASFARRKVNDEVWLPAEARFTGAGRALVRRFRVDTVTEYSDYRKFSVDSDTTFTLPQQDK